MAVGEQSRSAPTGISHSRGEQNLALAEMFVETSSVPGHLCRETRPVRSCPRGVDCICLIMGLLDALCFYAHQVL